MGTERVITKPQQPKFEDYLRRNEPPENGPYRGTRRQTTQSFNASNTEGGTQGSSTTEEGDMMNPDRAAALAEEARACVESRAERQYNIYSKEYQQSYALFEAQRKSIEQTFTWIKDSVSESYLETHVSITHDWVKAYDNLKAALNQGSREIQRAIREEYNQHMRLLKPSTRDLDGWISKWERLMIKGQRKSMTFALDKEDWSSRFLEAIRPLDNTWVTSLEHTIEQHLDDGTLTTADMSKAFRRLITRTKRARSTSRVSKGSFATRQQRRDEEPTEENQHQDRQSNQSPEHRGRSRSRSIDYSRKRNIDSMEGPSTKQICAGCKGLH
jgi:hypothetical protein